MRDVVATKNAIAGLLILENKWEEAFAQYQATLGFCRAVEEKQGVKTDAFQVIHCLWNSLACCAQCPSLLTAEQQTACRAELAALEQSFLAKTREKLEQTKTNLETQPFEIHDVDVALGYLREWATMLNFGVEVNLREGGVWKYSEQGCVALFKEEYKESAMWTVDSRILAFMNTITVCVRW